MRAQEFIAEAAQPQLVYRIDSHRIPDFEKNLKTYYHNKDFSVSGRSDFEGSVGKVKGVYAADRLFTALYATGSSEGKNRTKYVAIYGPGQPTVYFNKKDQSRIQGNRSWITAFDASKFRKLPSGEYFSENPGAPVSQQQISDPLSYIRSQGWQVDFVDDLEPVLKHVKRRAQAEPSLKWGAEGMGYSE